MRVCLLYIKHCYASHAICYHNNEMQNFSLSCRRRCRDEHTHRDFVLKSDRIRLMLAAQFNTTVLLDGGVCMRF